jgi:hypothetical protein
MRWCGQRIGIRWANREPGEMLFGIEPTAASAPTSGRIGRGEGQRAT